jgi:orotate phosphoribosyltransferase
MSTARQELLKLLAQKSFRLGEFKLSSGGTSSRRTASTFWP